MNKVQSQRSYCIKIKNTTKIFLEENNHNVFSKKCVVNYFKNMSKTISLWWQLNYGRYGFFPTNFVMVRDFCMKASI